MPELPDTSDAPAVRVRRLAALPRVRRALDYLKESEPETIGEQIRASEIPAPPFHEEARGAWCRRRFTELGLHDVRVDAVGNILAARPGAGDRPLLVLAAHLDTVFPEGTDVSVRREGSGLCGPGIGDNARGLAVILAVARALRHAGIETEGTLLFVANVGEEGLGDLRGIRHLFQGELAGKVGYFLSVDDAGLRITPTAVGSRRYRVTFRGPGGHSWGAFGLPNPIHALGRAIEGISRFTVPAQPKSTFCVGRMEGGTSVNAIAQSAWMEVDLRSESAEELGKLDARFHEAVQAALSAENATASGEERLAVAVEPIGDRPAGSQPADAPILQAALAADEVLGIYSELKSGSTDANIPLSLGIPALTLNGGGAGHASHTLEERFESTDSHLGPQRVLLLALGLVGIEQQP